MPGTIATDCLGQIFLEARSHNKWQDIPVSDELLRQLVDVLKMGPTSANQSPARIIFVKSLEANPELFADFALANGATTMSARAQPIIGYDMKFCDHLATNEANVGMGMSFANKI